MATAITLRHITKVFGPASGNESTRMGLARSAPPPGPETGYALEDISLTIRPGEVLGVLGPSGCGKTTLLKVVAGLIQPTSGQVLYDNIPLEQIPMRERGIGIVFQSYALYHHLPSIDNIGFFLRLRKREEEIPERVREISEFMRIDLKPLLARKPPTLSGGEKQRIAIARCLARDPKIFLFDEPFSNLDAKLRSSARLELKRLLQKYQVTSIYVPHDQHEAIALSDRIALLNRGRLEQIGSFHHLYETPANVFVAGFLGSPAMNLFPGQVANGLWQGKAFDWGPVRSDLADGMPLVLGIRPEHFRIDPEGPIVAVVDMIDRILSDRIQYLHTRVGPHTVTVRTDLEREFVRGQTLRLSVSAENVHLFDEATGLRLG
jgi:ABC-type sugar transport system ATPase subunit